MYSIDFFRLNKAVVGEETLAEEEMAKLLDAHSSGKASAQHVNIAATYYFFLLEDPDGNQLEITGGYRLDLLEGVGKVPVMLFKVTI